MPCGRRRPESCLASLRLVGWAALEGVAHVVCRGYPGSYPPQLVPERLVLVVQRRLKLVRAGANNAEQSSLWSNHHAELPSCVRHRRAV